MPSPIVNATLQAGILSATSNILAQAITSYRTNQPFTLHPLPILQFVLFALATCPLNFLWQQFLEDSFPGYSNTPALVANSEKLRSENVPGTKKLNLRNTAIKLALDQTLGAWGNTLLFIAGIGALKGMRGEEIVAGVRNDFWPLNRAGLKLWPLVSVISFTLVPVQRRTVFGSLVGVGWGVYLSLVAAGS